MQLYRTVGEKESLQIRESNFTAFPPRLPEQPVFYPVLNEQYAAEIAAKWNTKDQNSGYKGYVTCFEVDDLFLSKYQVQTVERSSHQEYWIPAGDPAELNRHIIGKIKILKEVSEEMLFDSSGKHAGERA